MYNLNEFAYKIQNFQAREFLYLICLKGTGVIVLGLCKTTKRKDQLYIQFTCFCMENHL